MLMVRVENGNEDEREKLLQLIRTCLVVKGFVCNTQCDDVSFTVSLPTNLALFAHWLREAEVKKLQCP